MIHNVSCLPHLYEGSSQKEPHPRFTFPQVINFTPSFQGSTCKTRFSFLFIFSSLWFISFNISRLFLCCIRDFCQARAHLDSLVYIFIHLRCVACSYDIVLLWQKPVQNLQANVLKCLIFFSVAPLQTDVKFFGKMLIVSFVLNFLLWTDFRESCFKDCINKVFAVTKLSFKWLSLPKWIFLFSWNKINATVMLRFKMFNTLQNH